MTQLTLWKRSAVVLLLFFGKKGRALVALLHVSVRISEATGSCQHGSLLPRRRGVLNLLIAINGEVATVVK